MPRSLWLPLLLSFALFTGCAKEASYYLERGNQLAADGDDAGASIEFRKAIQKDPKLGEAYLRLGLIELDQNNGVEALAALQRAVELMPESLEAKIQLADFALAVYQSNPRNQAMYNLLTDLADQLLTGDPDSFDGLRIRGDLALFGGQLEEAIDFFERANAARPNDKYLVLPYTEALLKAGREEQAVELARSYLDKDPASSELYDLLYTYYAASRQPAKAEEILRLKTTNNPDSTDARISLAAHFARSGDQNAARSVLEELTGDPNRFEDALLKSGSFLMGIQDWDGAIAVLQRGLETDPPASTRSEYLRLLATVRLAQNRGGEAADLLEQSIEADPQNSSSRFTQANLLLLKGDPASLARSIEEYQAILHARPADALLRLNLSKAYMAANQADKAREMLSEAARLNPRNLEARLLLAGLTLQMNMPADALRHLDEVLTLSPDDPGARLARAQALAALQRYDEAGSELERLARRFADSREVQVQQGLLAIRRQRYAEAEQILSGLVDSSTPDLRALAALTQVYSAQNQLDRAFDLVDAKLAESPDSPILRSLRATTALRAGKAAVAIDDYQRLAADNPQSPETLAKLGNAYVRLGRFDDALDKCSGALEFDSDSIAARLCVGIASQQLGRTEEAYKAYREVLDRSPNHPIAANNAAYLLAQSGSDLEHATGMLQAVVEQYPAYADALDTLGWIYLKRGMTDSALLVLSRIAQDYPDRASYQYHLGAALLENQDTAGAKIALEAALRKDLSPEERAEAGRLLNGIRR